MKKRICTVVIFTFAFVFAWSFFSGMYAAQKEDLPYNVPEGKKKQWESIQNIVEKEYNVCVEHCGNDTSCLTRCDTVYKSRLDREYKGLVAQMEESSAPADIAKHPSCTYCGMDRAKFAHSRVYIEYDDGSTLGACSLHCAAIDMAVHIDKAPAVMQVGDYNTKKLIDAEKAVWVIGGNKMGVMTRRAKWAFETKAAAEQFVQANGGEPATSEDALEGAYEDMYQDTKMIRERRKMKRMKKMK